jgi:transcriptional regulator with XRE-family HTH domain
MSLEALAGLTGRSKGWLSKIENGHSRLERRQDIAAIAEALEVSADSLVGEPAPEIQRHTRAYNFRPLRSALLDAAPPVTAPLTPPPTVRQVTRWLTRSPDSLTDDERSQLKSAARSCRPRTGHFPSIPAATTNWTPVPVSSSRRHYPAKISPRPQHAE